MSDPVVHLAGDMIFVGGYYVQRCMLCGAVILEGNASLQMTPGADFGVASFALGAFVAVATGNPSRQCFVGQAEGPVFGSDLDLPDDCCVRKKGEGS